MNSRPHPTRRILLVDDEPSVREALKLVLEFIGHEAWTADGGPTALALLEQQDFDLVLTDYSMPEMRGSELIALIQQRWPELPIILVSAFADDLRAAGKIPPGVRTAIGKPFSIEDVRLAIVQSLSAEAPPTPPPAISNHPRVQEKLHPATTA